MQGRRVEEAIADLWHEGRISGEMHLGIGEEGINAGVLDHLGDGDAVALDHRGTAGMVLRGVNLAPIIKECMGAADGLCGGMGGHMHLYSKDHLAGIFRNSGCRRPRRLWIRARRAAPTARQGCGSVLWRGRDEPGHADGGDEPGGCLGAAGPVRLPRQWHRNYDCLGIGHRW
jgi:hypothetical protein